MTAFMRALFFILLLWCGAVPAAANPAPGAGTGAPVILVWGDSLSAAYGIPVDAGWVQQLQKRLQGEAYPHRVVNGSVTGETTAGGLARLPAALAQHRPAIVLIELGGNDGLRGLPVKQLRANLAALVRKSRAAGAKVFVFEMRIPPNYGAAYAEAFQRAFAEVARAEGATLVPFFLEAIATDTAMFMDDGIHPTAEAQARLLDAVWPALQPALGKQAASGTAPAAP
jgi:acyl-CoA thioesterase I